jgi:fibro-slime domain-containing protein
MRPALRAKAAFLIPALLLAMLGAMFVTGCLNDYQDQYKLGRNGRYQPSYKEVTLKECANKTDDDGDGLVDCGDPDCGIFEMCFDTSGVDAENTLSRCGDGIDNDGNGKTDCADGTCRDFLQCNQVIAACNDSNSAPELKFEITIYDHPPGPEFQAACVNPGGCPDGVITGMVQNRLDAEGRPVFKPINLDTLDTIDIINWNPAGNYPAYTGCAGCGWWNQNIATWWRANTPGVVVTKDSLTFKHKGDNVYEYLNRRFFPLGENNYGFAVHMQRKFKYVAAGTKTQIFSFAGDDDAFVFLNGNLVLDFGGIHNPRFGFFVLGTEAVRYGIREGDEVTIDFFLAERMPSGTQAIISTSVPCQNQGK